MKPVPFDYVRPNTVAEACALLAQDAEARVIAGGQSLVPMLAMRLRTVAARDKPCGDFPDKSGKDYDPAVILDLDYWVLMPR